MGPPTTITEHGRHVLTISSAAEGQALPHEKRLYAARAFARNCRKWKDAVAEIIAHGLAADVAEADELLAECDA